MRVQDEDEACWSPEAASDLLILWMRFATDCSAAERGTASGLSLMDPLRARPRRLLRVVEVEL